MTSWHYSTTDVFSTSFARTNTHTPTQNCTHENSTSAAHKDSAQLTCICRLFDAFSFACAKFCVWSLLVGRFSQRKTACKIIYTPARAHAETCAIDNQKTTREHGRRGKRAIKTTEDGDGRSENKEGEEGVRVRRAHVRRKTETHERIQY